MKRIPSFKYLFGVADVLILFACFVLSAYILRVDSNVSIIQFITESPLNVAIFFLLALVFIIIFQYNQLYRVNIIITRAAHLAHIIKAFYYGALNVVLLSILIESSNLLDSRYLVFVFALIAIPTLYVVRIEILRLLYIAFSNTSFRRNVIIVGDGKAGKMLATKLMYENPIGLNIIGFVDDDKAINEEIVIGKKVVGNTHQIEELVAKHKIDELLIAVDDDNTERTLALIDSCKKLNISVRVTSELFDIVARRMKTESYFDVPVIDVSSHYNNSFTLALKRSFDIIFSSFTLIFLSPIIISIALVIKLTSPGSILFKQTRVGKYGKEFQFYKFRSMKVIIGEDEDRKKQMLEFMSDSNADLRTKIINDNRVTWIGKIIRTTSLDELPQLFNVIKGDMSLVGPRPCLPYEYENYDEWQKRRVKVIPGCTGVWQVWGRSTVSFKESVVLDLYYINNMSPWLDLQLVLQTIPAIIAARGAK
ncbi:MAG: sugar transferase [Ignavibacteria bacterium]|nr:sugar transferase [Ignavibacteria bacterium]MBT8381667.1 sugar transferase [Ignavibacteria bacterium]NNJ53055.1 sugar transferase [Ignavibacteriaceae bacterium]